jgi:glycosyltransferase involved in cell wall biosynthesis
MKLRIAMISEHASPIAPLGGVDTGGQNVYVAQVAAHLVRLGHDVDVFTRRDNVLTAEMLRTPDGYRVVHVPAGPPCTIPKEELLPHMAAFGEYMHRQLVRGRYDLIHANFFMSGLAAMHLKRALGIPFVVTFHALGRVRLLHQAAMDRFPAERLAIEDQIVIEADRIIAECPQDADDQVRLYAADPDKLRVVPCGFDESELVPIARDEARNELGIDPKLFTVLQLGRLVPRKGVDDAIRGFARLVHDHRVAAQMLIVGGESDLPDPQKTPEIGRLQRIAKSEEVADRVIFAGRADRRRLKYFYSAADVFVTTPWYEPFGITPLEAMACGTPVVGADVGGIKYSVSDGQTGFLIPPRDPGSLARRLADLAANETLRARLGRQGLRRVRQLFTWRKVTEAIVKVYEEVVSRPAPLRLNGNVGSVNELKSTI